MPTTYTVTGRWPFPTDMLRYDEAWGAPTCTSEEAANRFRQCRLPAWWQ